MDLLEYQGKQLFRDHGVPTPDGQPAQTAQEAVEAAEELGYPVVIKAQVLIGGRGKAGGIKVANDREEAREHAEAILGMDIRGLTVRELYVEAATDIAEEYYAAILLDRGAKQPMAMLSRMGGMDVEEIAERDPAAIARVHVDSLIGFQDFHGRRLCFEAGIAGDVTRPVGALLARLYETFVAEDAMLVEVNPLLVTEARDVVALDAKVTVDGNALFRHPNVAAMRNPSAEDPQEQMARERGLTYVKLDGNIGVLGNGAGLVMSTLDVVAQAGGRPANFLDAGGGSKAEAIVGAVEVILSDPKVDAVLFNIFGGITRCDEVARGLVTAFGQIDVKVPFVVRLDGTNDEEGRRIIAEAQLPSVTVEKTMLDAAAREGSFHGLNNRRYGTELVAGVTPGKGGQDVEGVPIFDTVHEAVAETGANTSMVFVPPRFAADSVLEAAAAGVELVVCITEGIPAHDMLRVYTHLRRGSTRMIGPNCPGVLSPGKANVGIIPAHFFSEGGVGLVSRSGTLTYQIGNELAQRGFGNSTIVGIGGDPVVGSSFIDIISLFERDDQTELIVMCGEIGGDEEERTADFIAENVSKPVVGYIAGFTAPPGKTMGHAGAIVSGSSGTAAAKAGALEAKGVRVGRTPTQVSDIAVEILGG